MVGIAMKIWLPERRKLDVSAPTEGERILEAVTMEDGSKEMQQVDDSTCADSDRSSAEPLTYCKLMSKSTVAFSVIAASL